ncbi:hypothetical protein QBC41DRAFT_321676 [Cercophora samala]|uniref:Uncharacterized protein n=1 Tax=Cercophora samala TaxID=330535 RepID=A0AA39ZCQ0_9PEZI|nr:hypothetical protein QBC41DRAFT_321676 [Cercophora samala]
MAVKESEDQPTSSAASKTTHVSSYSTTLDIDEHEVDSWYGLSSEKGPSGSYVAAYAEFDERLVTDRNSQENISHVGAGFISTMGTGQDDAASRAELEKEAKKVRDTCLASVRGELGRNLTCRHSDGTLWCERCAIRVNNNPGLSTPRGVPDTEALEIYLRKNRQSEKARRPSQRGGDLDPRVPNERWVLLTEPRTVVNLKDNEEGVPSST